MEVRARDDGLGARIWFFSGWSSSSSRGLTRNVRPHPQKMGCLSRSALIGILPWTACVISVVDLDHPLAYKYGAPVFPSFWFPLPSFLPPSIPSTPSTASLVSRHHILRNLSQHQHQQQYKRPRFRLKTTRPTQPLNLATVTAIIINHYFPITQAYLLFAVLSSLYPRYALNNSNDKPRPLARTNQSHSHYNPNHRSTYFPTSKQPPRLFFLSTNRSPPFNSLFLCRIRRPLSES